MLILLLKGGVLVGGEMADEQRGGLVVVFAEEGGV